jgi:hypothetical protein
LAGGSRKITSPISAIKGTAKMVRSFFTTFVFSETKEKVKLLFFTRPGSYAMRIIIGSSLMLPQGISFVVLNN